MFCYRVIFWNGTSKGLVFFYVLEQLLSLIFCLLFYMLLLFFSNSISTGTGHVQPWKKMFTGQFLVFRSGKVPTLNFWKVRTCPPLEIFLEATVCVTSAKTENAHISTENVVWRRLTTLWNSQTKENKLEANKLVTNNCCSIIYSFFMILPA